MRRLSTTGRLSRSRLIRLMRLATTTTTAAEDTKTLGKATLVVETRDEEARAEGKRGAVEDMEAAGMAQRSAVMASLVVVHCCPIAIPQLMRLRTLVNMHNDVTTRCWQSIPSRVNACQPLRRNSCSAVYSSLEFLSRRDHNRRAPIAQLATYARARERSPQQRLASHVNHAGPLVKRGDR